MEPKQDFYDIGALTREFNKLSDGGRRPEDWELRLWALRFELSQAQQLAVISSRLKAIEDRLVKGVK